MYLWIQNQKSTQNALKLILSQNLAQDHVEVWNGVIGVERVLKNKSEYNFFFSNRITIFDARSEA